MAKPDMDTWLRERVLSLRPDKETLKACTEAMVEAARERNPSVAIRAYEATESLSAEMQSE